MDLRVKFKAITNINLELFDYANNNFYNSYLIEIYQIKIKVK
jgi:hypothetical protein